MSGSFQHSKMPVFRSAVVGDNIKHKNENDRGSPPARGRGGFWLNLRDVSAPQWLVIHQASARGAVRVASTSGTPLSW